MTSHPVLLGPFELEEQIGRGGMAEVWRGVHRTQDVPVAVKIMTGGFVDKPVYRAGFRNEVRAVAGLDHPNIIVIYDEGQVSADAQWLTRGRLRRGSPFLAMELVSGGTLAQIGPNLTWPHVRRVLELLLDALAHAHARGVIHLDLKPDNVLLPQDGTIEGLKLTDFGIAHAETRPAVIESGIAKQPEEPSANDAESPLLGTPIYMAPEQFAAQWRDFGPWTDLYTLGCVAYELVTGTVPFDRPNALLLAEAHWCTLPPPLSPRFELPSGFSEWTMRLLEKRPCDRYQFAADAAYALSQLEDPVEDDDDDETFSSDATAFHTIRFASPDALEARPGSRVRLSSAEQRVESSAEGETAGPTPVVESLWDEKSGIRVESLWHDRIQVPGRDDVQNGGAADSSTGQDGGSAPGPCNLDWGDESSMDGRMRRSQRVDTEEALRSITIAWDRTRAGGTVCLESPRPEAPPVPATWELPGAPTPSMLLEGAGLGLYGLRTIPLVDRAVERDTMWDALREVAASGGARAVLLHGAAGTGKSRLVEWIAERALEVGAGRVLTAVHGPDNHPSHGLPAMIARHMRCIGLVRSKADERVKRLLDELGGYDEYEWKALAELVAPANLELQDASTSGDRGGARLGRPLERYAILQGYLERISEERPIILWMDDVQWGSDSLQFVLYLLREQALRPAPILILLTAQDDALAEQQYEAGQLETLLQMEGVDRLTVPPLSRNDHRVLVRELLGLEGGLASRVESRTAGNPLFAVQLVGDWVQRGLLIPGRSGFGLKTKTSMPLPDTLHEVWAERIRRVMHGQPEGTLHALEMAAALGQSVQLEEWKASCREARLTIPNELLDTLLAHRLIQMNLGKRNRQAPKQVVWSFVHGMLRESLIRSAQEGKRWRSHNLACARALRARYAGTEWSVVERLGRHFCVAGEFEQALEPLLRAAESARERGEYHLAKAAIERRERALRATGGRGRDARWGDGWLFLAQMALDREKPAVVARELERIEAHAARPGWGRVKAAALRVKGDLARYKGDYRAAAALYQAARPMLGHHNARREAAHCLRGMGNAAWEQGLVKPALEMYEKALHLYQQVGDSYRQLSCLVFLGHVAQQTGRVAEARKCFQRAIELGKARGHLSGVSDALRGLGRISLYNDKDTDQAEDYMRRAKSIIDRIGGKHAIVFCLNEIGEVARERGDYERAKKAYRKTLDKTRETAAVGMWGVPALNLATLYIQEGSFDVARALLRPGPSRLERQGHRRLLGTFHAALFLCASEAGEWGDADAHLERAEKYLGTVGVLAPDDFDLVDAGAELAAKAGEEVRTARARALADRLREATENSRRSL